MSSLYKMEDQEDAPVVEEEAPEEPAEPALEEKVETPPPPRPKKSRAAPSEPPPIEDEPKKRPRKYLKAEFPGCGVVCSHNHLKFKHKCPQAAPKAKAKSRPKKRDDPPDKIATGKVEYEDPAIGMRILYRELKAQEMERGQSRYAKYFV